MAPEVKDEDNDDSDEESDKCRYNLKSDIYSLGVIATKLFDFKDKIKDIRKITEMLVLIIEPLIKLQIFNSF